MNSVEIFETTHVFRAEMCQVCLLSQRFIKREGPELFKVKVVFRPNNEIVRPTNQVPVGEADGFLLKRPSFSP